MTKPIKRKRLLYLDLLRGLFLVFIILNHVPFAPKITDIFTGDGLLISSAAEGFFLLSGLMVAYLYLPRILTETKSVLSKIWRRSALLYSLSVLTTLIFTTLALLIAVDPTSGHVYNNIFSITFIQDVLSLSYTYGWADFLARYAVFMLGAPFALLLIAYRKTWLLLGLSVLLWFVSPSLGFEYFTAWQLLFVIGMIIGSKLDTLMIFLQKKSGLKVLLIITFAVSLLWSLYVDLLYPHIIAYHFNNSFFIFAQSHLALPENVRGLLFNKESLSFLRIIFSVLWFLVALFIFSKYERCISKYSGNFLSFLGKNSLTVYIIHAFIIFLLFAFYVSNQPESNIVINSFIGVVAVISTTLITKFFIILKKKPRLP